MACIYPALLTCYQYCVPSFIADHIETVSNELLKQLEKPYIGGTVYHFKGEGDNYLKGKKVFTTSNPYDLAKSVVFYSTIFAVGYLVASTISLTLGGLGMFFSAFYGASELKEKCFGKEFQMKTALDKIKSLDTIARMAWKHGPSHKIEIDPSLITESVMRGVNAQDETKVVIFKLKPPEGAKYDHLIKIYYLGSNQFVRSTEMKEVKVGEGKAVIKIESKNLLNGLEIGPLLGAANPKK